MTVYRTLAAVLSGSLLVSTASAKSAPNAEPVIDPVSLVSQMANVTQQLSYQLSYINISSQGIESMRYRHALVNGHTYAQLLQMDGPYREVIQRDNNISYYDASSGVEAFTLPGRQIIDGIPSVLYANIKQIKKYYDFISVGRARVANEMCDVIRIVSQDGSRYSYVVWLDDSSKLPMRIDLLGQSGEPIDQFQVIEFSQGEAINKALQPLLDAQLPQTMTNFSHSDSDNLGWRTGWLPAGMHQVSQSRRQLPDHSKLVASRLYSDGLFSFTVNVSDADRQSRSKVYSIGRRTALVEIRNDKEISVVGDIPRQTAKRIADSVRLGD